MNARYMYQNVFVQKGKQKQSECNSLSNNARWST